MSDSGEFVENCIEIIRAYKKCYRGNPSIHDIFRGFPLKFHFCCGLYVRELLYRSVQYLCTLYLNEYLMAIVFITLKVVPILVEHEPEALIDFIATPFNLPSSEHH